MLSRLVFRWLFIDDLETRSSTTVREAELASGWRFEPHASKGLALLQGRAAAVAKIN